MGESGHGGPSGLPATAVVARSGADLQFSSVCRRTAGGTKTKSNEDQDRRGDLFGRAEQANWSPGAQPGRLSTQRGLLAIPKGSLRPQRHARGMTDRKSKPMHNWTCLPNGTASKLESVKQRITYGTQMRNPTVQQPY